jgi:hypothetical protein
LSKKTGFFLIFLRFTANFWRFLVKKGKGKGKEEVKKKKEEGMSN